MTTLAVRPELAAMDIRVAVSAMRADLLEYKVRMALSATNLFVHSPQGISSLIVIEFWM